VKLTSTVTAAAIVIVMSLTSSFSRHGDAETKMLVITVQARRYEFNPSEITLKRGQKVKLIFVSDDVPHGVVVEGLGIDLDIETKHSKEVIITPLEVGDFEGRCSRYCGPGHRAMTLIVHVAG
jgi:cytochrome c oxidase subunit 2